jgi:hypothetical protein
MKGKLDSLTEAWRGFTDSMYRMFASAVARWPLQQLVLAGGGAVFGAMLGACPCPLAMAAGSGAAGGLGGMGGPGRSGPDRTVRQHVRRQRRVVRSLGTTVGGFLSTPLWGSAEATNAALLAGQFGETMPIPSIGPSFGGVYGRRASQLAGLYHARRHDRPEQSPYSGLTAVFGAASGSSAARPWAERARWPDRPSGPWCRWSARSSARSPAAARLDARRRREDSRDLDLPLTSAGRAAARPRRTRGSPDATTTPSTPAISARTSATASRARTGEADDPVPRQLLHEHGGRVRHRPLGPDRQDGFRH